MAQAPLVDDYNNPVYQDQYEQREQEDRDPAEFADAAQNKGIAGPAPAPAQPRPQWNDREVDAWRNTGGTTRQQLEDYYNTHWKDMGVELLKNDKIRSPYGREFDLIGNFGTAEAKARTGYTTDPRYSSGAKPKGNATTKKTKASTAPAAKATAPTVAAPAAPAGPTPEELAAQAEKAAFDKQISDAILKLLGRGSAPLSKDDPNVAGQFGALSATMQRGKERAQAEAAERQAYQGTSFGGAGGALDTEQRGIAEDLALGEGELMAGLMSDELEARRQDVVNALGFAQGEQKIKLTEQLAQMDDALEKLKLQQQESQYGRSLAENARQFNVGEAGVNRRFNAGEAGTNARFGQTMDYNYDRFGFDRNVWEYETNAALNKGLG